MIRKALMLAALAVTLAACGSARPLQHDIAQPDEIPPGPGLFTGKDGKLVLYGNRGTN